MDLVEASQNRIPIAVEIERSYVRLACEIMRLGSGKIAWAEDAWLFDPLYPGHPFHLVEGDLIGDGLEWCADSLRFFEIPRDDGYLMHFWQGYERAREQAGAEAVRARALEIAESEFGTAS